MGTEARENDPVRNKVARRVMPRHDHRIPPFVALTVDGGNKVILRGYKGPSMPGFRTFSKESVLGQPQTYVPKGARQRVCRCKYIIDGVDTVVDVFFRQHQSGRYLEDVFIVACDLGPYGMLFHERNGEGLRE